ncbi:MAG: winged helix-turn-helix transcriptional regulator [Holophagaceae bacterium]|nr:winged helix-turn-helix transcriptional regulator [Holophagaceae bacterium]
MACVPWTPDLARAGGLFLPLLGREEGITRRELATRVGLDPATLSVALRKLEETGIIEPPTTPENRQSRRVRCAPMIQHLGAILKMLKELDELALEGIPEKEIVLARRMLAKIHQNLASAQARK